MGFAALYPSYGLRAKYLDPAMVASALGDASTKLPTGMKRPATWPDRILLPKEREEWIRTASAARGKES